MVIQVAAGVVDHGSPIIAGSGIYPPGVGTAQQGNAGGYGYNINNIAMGGGGGGAGGQGGNASTALGIFGNGGAAIIINSTNLPGYNNIIAICGGGGGASVFYTSVSASYSLGGTVTYNGVTYSSGGSAITQNSGTNYNTTNFNATSYGGGGAGGLFNNTYTGTGYQGVCIITYLNTQ
jgi:hypothetical protein